ncbi:MAG: CRTAC1 family protein [Acidimicrobiia bacterium]|nr:CRTAC1 family protein [Acidimicrobiia bacterium]
MSALIAADPPGKPAAYPFAFRDVGEEAGLFPHLEGIRGHGAAWGDVDGDGWIELYVGTFHTPDVKPNMLFRNAKGKFRPDDQKPLTISSRSTGIVFADLDDDGDLDLYVASMPQPKNNLAGCRLFRNDGGGKFADVSEASGACPPAFGGRAATVLDFDGDGRLDLLVGEDPIPGYNGSRTKSSRLFRNTGGLRFEDVSRAAGLPENVPGLGAGVADVNCDGWPDLLLASSAANVLFVNDGRGKFTEVPGSRKAFAWERAGGDNMVCGVCFGDVDRDGRPDVVLGQHYQDPWRSPVPVRLYLNRGAKGGVPEFEDVTEKVGLTPLAMKAPHVELQDFDNDGWPDVYVSTVKFAGGKPYPVIFRHQGVADGLPRFRDDAWAVNDFPTPEDAAIRRSGQLFEKVLREKKIIYTAPGPSGDFDNDGRLDLFLPNWWPESRSLLLRNETAGGNWLRVRVEGGAGVNRMGIGSKVKVYAAGKLGDAAGLLGCREIATGYGYASGQPAEAHFGLGEAEAVDVEVVLPHGKGTLARKRVKANQALAVKR